MHISEQETTPIPSSEKRFHAYLERYGLTWVEVAQAAGVPAAVVWLIDHGRPVHPENAQKVRQGLNKLTGVAYRESITVITQPPMKRGNIVSHFD